MCDQLQDEYYHRLCKVLSLPYRDDPDPVGFTGNNSLDMLILEQLEDKDLLNICRTNKHLNDLCNNEDFWAYRTIKMYGDVLGDDGYIIKEKYIPPNVSWKHYYLWLSNALLQPAQILLDLIYVHKREDIKLFYDRMEFFPETGYIGPLYISPTLRKFLLQANLGPTDPTVINSPPLIESLNSIRIGISTMGILTILFTIYIYNNDISNNDKTFTPDREFYEYFGSILKYEDIVTFKDFKYIIEMNASRRQYPNHPFSIETPNREELDRMLSEDYAILRNIMDYYRRNRIPIYSYM
jgi:hypothetical protein